MIKIRLYQSSDCPSVAALMIESESHHGPAPTREDVERDLSQLPAGVEVLVAANDDKIVAFAAFSTLYPGACAQPQFFLKELFVSEAYRRKNIGQQLMLALMEAALQRGYKRIDWTMREDNLSAQHFYEKIGATQVTETLLYRLQNDALTTAANKLARLR
jgi:ribosomal protein S18 acetylase RimI-like enzyme